MENKAFKEMIKKHEVKQSFTRVMEDKECLLRFYQHTADPQQMFCCKWEVDPCSGKLDKSVEPLDIGTWKYHWHKYTAEVQELKESDAPHDYTDAAFEQFKHAPMELKKYYLIKAETFQFMLKDKRVGEQADE